MTKRKIGIEEELLLVDATTGQVRPLADRVIRAQGDGDSADEVEQELFLQQLETGTESREDLEEVLTELRRTRATAVSAARSAGADVIASGTPVLRPSADVTPSTRYHEMMLEFGQLAETSMACGMHVHVDIDSEDEAIAVVDRMRPWLPLLAAMSANSPFYDGAETGYASWRTQVWSRWPSAGPTESFGSPAGYRAATDAIVASGAAMDRKMLYLDARPAEAYPTVEVRVMDINADLRTNVVLGGLVRALISTASQEWKADKQPLPWRVELLRAARWRAARDGLGGVLLDPLTQAPVPAPDAMHILLEHTGAALEADGDLPMVKGEIMRLLTEGTGAHLQRVTAEKSDGDLIEVVRDLIDRTAAG